MESHKGLRRLHALDGLRGLASLVVVFSHALLTTTISDDYVAELQGRSSGSTIAELLANTPVQYLFMGTEAVIIFFVLSGLVLALPMLRGRSLDLWAYYPRRFIRLWVPAAASIVLAVSIIMLTHQDPISSSSSWVKEFSFSTLSARDVLASFMLITGDHKLNNPMWSLKWEMLFSLMLPICVLLVWRLRRLHWWALLVCAVASAAGAGTGVAALRYMPMFIAGVVVARLIADCGAPGRLAGVLYTVGGSALLAAPIVVRALPVGVPMAAIGEQAAIVLGAAMIVLGLTGRSFVSTLFSSRPFRFLGRISFGLYLVHVPVLLGSLHAFPVDPNAALLISLPLALTIGTLFTLFVEEPSARLARRVGEWAASVKPGERLEEVAREAPRA